METTTAAVIAHTMRKLEPPFKTNPRPRLPFSNKQGNHHNCSFFVSRHLSAQTTGSVTLVDHNKMMSYSNSSLFCKLGFHIGQKCSLRTPFECHCQGAAIRSNTTLFSNCLKMMILISSVESLASFKQKSFYRIKIVQ